LVKVARQKAVREYSSGGIVFRVIDKTIEILLLQDLKTRWSIPKGHIESGETPKQAAVREVSEETNIKELKVHSKLDKIHFFYRMEGKLIFMTNFVFLIESTNSSEKLQTEADAPWIVDVQWFDAEQAYDILEYKATKIILREAINRIKVLKKL
jgi:8-oxo-dGTP pyrophosphatase MutT (NUDIX family)